MNLSRLIATCLLALLVAACATTSLNKAESNTWLDLRAGAADYDISGKWDSGGSWTENWGSANFIQDGARFYGQLGSYYVDGSINGNYMYLALSSGKTVYYTASLKKDPDGSYRARSPAVTSDGPGADKAGVSLISLRRVKDATAPKPAANPPARAL
ncbi:MAG: hypothetical protein IPJ50_17735 [Betaproteobacteria bacterium]|nr:hypothetical protein [Betaproteobacteria bacterium]